MRRIDSYGSKRAHHLTAYRRSRLIAKSALVSMLLFSGLLCSSASASAGDGLPPDCCQYFSEADTGSFVADVSVFRSTGRTEPSRTARQPMIGIMTKPSLRHWEFDYQVTQRVDSALVDSALVDSVLGSSEAVRFLSGFAVEASMFQSLLQSRSWFAFKLPLETQAELAILKRALVAEFPGLISTNLLQLSSPLPIRLFERAIWELQP